MADPSRARKIADRIKVIVAEYLEFRLKDERLGFVTITDARVTGDLQQASVFYTVFGSNEERQATADVLEANKGRIRSAVGKGIGIRLTPSIEFIADALPEGAAHLEDLVAQTRARDEELARAAANATPAGGTSHDVVARARRLCGTRRVGHAGTLDPMATGVLVLGVERGTKLLTFLVGCDKSYAATICLGMAIFTDDAEGETTQALGVDDVPALEAALPAAVAALTGDLQQVPSSVSAIKVKGVRSYTRVRQGDSVDLPARPVTVSRFDVLSVRPGTATVEVGPPIDVVDVEVEVDVSSGTYVRALARDLGEALGVGGHLTALRRTRVGRFGLDAAVSLDDLTVTSDADGPDGIPLLPIADAARAQLPVHEVTAEEAVALGYGQRIRSAVDGSDAVAAIDPDGRLVAVLDETRPTARAKVIFAASGAGA